MKSFGLGLMGLGALAMVLYFLDYVPSLLQWIYNWGNGVAWAIMIGLVALGGVVAFIGMKSEKAANEKTEA